MNLLHLVLTLALLAVHLAALGALCQRGFPDRQIARAAGLLALVLIAFFIEHFVALGRLSWLWPVATLAAVAGLRRSLWQWSFWRQELPFALPFCWALMWRYFYPDIEPTAEQITDLYFVSNYAAGEILPPPDRWLPGERFDFYYGLLPYAVALLARFYGLEVGYALNLAGALLFGLLGSLAWSLAGRLVARRGARALVVVATVAGGTGVAPLLPLLYPSDAVRQLWANTRFIGLYDQEIATPLGQRLFPRAPGGEARDLPLETPSYLLYLGDVHPPLAGFALLLFSLALVARLQRPEPPDDARPLTAALGASAVVPFALNAWILPLQGLLVAAWAAYRRASRQPLFMPWLLGGALTAAALLYPFLTYFSGRAAATPFVFTAAADFTPWRPALAVWWPVLWLVLLSLLPGSPPRLARASALAVIGLWLLAEFVTVDDPNGGRYQRFNTVLKWWSWLYLGALVWLGALQLGAAARWRRVAAAVPLLAVSLYLWPQLLYWSQTPRPHAGRLQGDGWLRADAADRAILDWLKAAPPGVVLERTEHGAYSAASALALFSGQFSALGWPSHVAQWRGRADVYERQRAALALYRAELPNAAEWLRAHRVRYVVWSAREAVAGAETLERLRVLLRGEYQWIPLGQINDQEYGVFAMVAAAAVR